MKTKLNSEIRNHGAHGLSRRSFAKAEVTRPTWALLFLCLLWLATTFTAQAAPLITNVTTSVSVANVTISYNISDASFSSANVYVLVSADHGTNWIIPAINLSGTYGLGVPVNTSLTTNTVIWNAVADWPGHYTTNCRVRVVACDNGMVMIPAGSSFRGNAMSADTDITDAPQYQVFVNPFLMDSNLVSYSQWQTVYNWAIINGYYFDNAGSGQAANHPVQTVDWYDAVKWCNARSEIEGVPPVYYEDCSYTTVYRSMYHLPVCMKTNANGTVVNGYRLPTEAEWEKAARGGLTGKRFPWGDTIAALKFNPNPVASYTELGGYYFWSSSGGCSYTNFYSYDGPDFYGPAGPSCPATASNGPSSTSPVGSFPANGYNLYDMAGNVNEWCWDWYSSTYYVGGQTNPTGPNSGTSRVLRGGSWLGTAPVARCANRGTSLPYNADNTVGFRCVRGF